MSAFTRRVVFLTGAGGGLGREFARQLLAAGADLVLSSHNPQRLAAAAEYAAHKLPNKPVGRIRALLPADLSDPTSCDRLAQQVAQVAPDLDLIIHNAGIGLYGPLDAIPAEAADRLLRINLHAPIRLTAALLPIIHHRPKAQIVFISSILGRAALPNISIYSATKFGLRGFAGGLTADGYCVSTVYPFFTQTDILDSPQYGDGPARRVPGWLLDQPSAVVRASLAGIAARRRHIFPSWKARLYAVVAAVAPDILPPFSRLI
ncbi:SDR family NAD(P)-dependent oxidoreductase [Chloroflexus sp.]|uniref:SDR family NAD(P)-dependent oxidoreductase n=1 Tax=Chloroflexus sp. TaxID=1904827 RepID=UPI0026141D44|nr:SDR family NAD(P)-dependent oxidoreductase [uncultured Chloroflexus sp.]